MCKLKKSLNIRTDIVIQNRILLGNQNRHSIPAEMAMAQIISNLWKDIMKLVFE